MDTNIKLFNGDLSSNLPQLGHIGDFYPYYEPLIEKHYFNYPIYTTYHSTEKSKVEQAFKIVQVLIEKKLVKVDKVKEFIELVNEIVEIV